MGCEDKIGLPRDAADSRLRITLDDGKMAWKIQDMNFATARECAARAALHLRKMDIYAIGGNESREIEGVGPMVVAAVYPDEEMQTVCLVHEPESGAIQVAVNGITIFQATILCESFVFEMNQRMMGVPIDNGAAI